GFLYTSDQTSTQEKPMAPTTTKEGRHPQYITMMGTMIGAVIAPTLLPALKMPVARARSLAGNHSDTALMEAGKLPPSARPRQAPATLKPSTVLMSACMQADKLHEATATGRPSLMPILSIKRPTPM